MTRSRWQYSLRTLLLVMTVVAVVIAFVAHHLLLVMGLVVFALAVLEVAIELLPAFLELEGPKTTRQIRREQAATAQKPTDE